MGNFDKIQEVLGHLPAAEVADAVVQDVKGHKIGILAAPTGSGKSLVVSARLADNSSDRVVVLMPRRLLVTDAAKNIAEITGTKVGDAVGYALGSRPGEESNFSDKTKLLFVTYGYALKSGIINKAHTFVLDEVHEKGEDISLARAILHKRRRMEPTLQIMEMSATINAKQQSRYWSDVAPAAIHQVDKTNLEVDSRQIPMEEPGTLEKTAIDLLNNEGRKGVAIFLPSVKSIVASVGELRRQCQRLNMKDVEIEPIFGDLSAAERARAVTPPAEGHRKILVGTNVIESGVNLRWVDAGISSGTGKIPYVRQDTGAEALVLEELPQWRIIQQRGRINRDPKHSGFDKGIFILGSKKGMDKRPPDSTPELERVSPVGLVFKAASLGLNPSQLKFDAKITKQQLLEARDDLVRLGLIEHGWALSKDGQFASRLPVSPECGAMLAEAQRIDNEYKSRGKNSSVLYDAITLVAVMEAKGLRADYKKSHGLDDTSDLLDGYEAILQLGAHAKKSDCSALNVSWKRYHDALQLMEELQHRLGVEAGLQTSHNDLRRTMLSGSVNRMFLDKGWSFQDVIRGHSGYTTGRGSVAEKGAPRIVTGKLREIATDDEPITILDAASRISSEVFLHWAASRKDTVLSDMHFQGHKPRTHGKHKRQKEEWVRVEANYFGHYPITLDIPPQSVQALKPTLRALQERSDGEERFGDKPAGRGNAEVTQHQPHRARGR